MIVCYKWGNCDVQWKNANWRWSECQIVQEIVSGLPQPPGVPGELALPPWLQEETPYSPYDKDKRERFIKLLCKIKGEPEYDEQKKVKTNIKITINDIKLVVKSVKGIDIQIIEE